jgi:hypothetical protein
MLVELSDPWRRGKARYGTFGNSDKLDRSDQIQQLYKAATATALTREEKRLVEILPFYLSSVVASLNCSVKWLYWSKIAHSVRALRMIGSWYAVQ